MRQLSTAAAVVQVTSTESAPTLTPQPTNTPLPPYYWDGVWEFQVPGGTISGVGIDQYGYLIQSTKYNVSPINYYLYATLSESFQVISGTIVPDAMSAAGLVLIPFQLKMLDENHDQFVGSFVITGVTYAFCGARNGAQFPNPCQWP